MIRRPPRSTLDRSSAASDVYKRQAEVQRRAMQLATVLEPLLIVTMGLVVMLIVLAVICLLYTSPSPRNRTRSRMPASALKKKIHKKKKKQNMTGVFYTLYERLAKTDHNKRSEQIS